jgi:hypothetical protein
MNNINTNNNFAKSQGGSLIYLIKNNIVIVNNFASKNDSSQEGLILMQTNNTL